MFKATIEGEIRHESEFEDYLDKWFASYKKLYRERNEKFMKQHGYVKGKEKRNQEHFKWLVHYQIQGWSLRQIIPMNNKDAEVEIHYNDVIDVKKSKWLLYPI